MLAAKFATPAGAPFLEEGRPAYAPSRGLLAFEPRPLAPSEVVGRTVARISTSVGTYGMGGPGFVGFQLEAEWLVVAIWGAAAWIHVDGRSLEDLFYERHGRPRPWIGPEGDDLSPALVGAAIAAVDVEADAMRLAFANGRVATIEKDARLRPVFEGDQALRAFTPEEDLRRAVFLCPTDELWV